MVTTDVLKVKIIEGLNFEDIEPSDIGDTDPLFGDGGLGLDSVDAIELTMVIEKEFGVKVTNIADAESIFATVTSLCDYINAHKNV
ncbi:acyl carrier protein [bacterium]|jgi:acyl carrier protein|nr:acyl carrier protein [bacterium]